MLAKCIQCGKEKEIRPARANTFKFCSYKCRGDWRRIHWTQENHPGWTGGKRKKVCKHCGKTFGLRKNQPITTFRRQKFCCKPCADKGGDRLRGKDNPLYRENARRRNRGGPHRVWVRSVINRDKATCQHCGARKVELHAHHIKPYEDYPELRFDVSNGITLCYKCHWDVHSAENENGVNSGKLLTGDAEDNPEPSLGGNTQEGVTARGRAYRRWDGNCHWCGAFISKRWSDISGKKHVFCCKHCMGKHAAATRKWRRGKNMEIPPTAVISSKSAPRESDDIA